MTSSMEAGLAAPRKRLRTSAYALTSSARVRYCVTLTISSTDMPAFEQDAKHVFPSVFALTDDFSRNFACINKAGRPRRYQPTKVRSCFDCIAIQADLFSDSYVMHDVTHYRISFFGSSVPLRLFNGREMRAGDGDPSPLESMIASR